MSDRLEFFAISAAVGLGLGLAGAAAFMIGAWFVAVGVFALRLVGIL